MNKFCFLISFTLVLTTTASADIYKYTDENGNVSFLNAPYKNATRINSNGSDEDSPQYKAEDYAQILKKLLPYAKQGDAGAQTSVGWIYEKGQGVPQDYTQALVWYRKAAEQGFSLAQTSLGLMYEKGYGVMQNKVVAYALFNIAAMDSASIGAKSRDISLMTMAPKQIEAGQVLSREMMKPNNLNKAIVVYLKKPN